MTITSTVKAFIESADLTATSGMILVNASADTTANPDVLGAAVGALTVNVINYVASIGGSTEAYVTGDEQQY